MTTAPRRAPAAPAAAARRAPVHQPGALLARLQRARPPRGPRRAQPAARAGEVPGDLRLQPRRVLPGPRLRPHGAGRGGERQALARRPHGGRAAGGDPRPRPRRSSTSTRRLCARSALGSPPKGVAIVDYAEIPEHHARLRERYLEEIFPVLTPLAVAPGPPVPVHQHAQPLARGRGARIPATGEQRFARVKVPPILPRLVHVERHVYVPLEQVIAANLDALFPGVEIVEPTCSGSPATPTSTSRRTRPGDLLLGHRGGAASAALRLGGAARGRGGDARGDAGVPPRRASASSRRPATPSRARST